MGVVDPLNIEEYIARDGYLVLNKALTKMTPEDVIKEIKDSGLRGRGGCRIPNGNQMGYRKGSKSDVKYMICNADEGDPGAFMDRSVLEGDPHSIVEAMTIRMICNRCTERVRLCTCRISTCNREAW